MRQATGTRSGDSELGPSPVARSGRSREALNLVISLCLPVPCRWQFKSNTFFKIEAPWRRRIVKRENKYLGQQDDAYTILTFSSYYTGTTYCIAPQRKARLNVGRSELTVVG